MGLKKGMTNNPAGKPKGAKNKVQSTVKTRIIEFVNTDFDKFITQVEELETKDKVKAKLELIKLITPRPLNDEEVTALAKMNPLLDRLFSPNKKD